MNKYDEEYFFITKPRGSDHLPSLSPDTYTENRKFRYGTHPFGSPPLVFSKFFTLLSTGLAMLISANALATEQIICDSKTFNAAFAVGSDGYVSNMELSDISEKHFSEVLEITDMPKNRRHISIEEQRVDVKAIIDKKIINVFVINIRNGKGYIKFDSLKEEMTCDWDI